MVFQQVEVEIDPDEGPKLLKPETKTLSDFYGEA